MSIDIQKLRELLAKAPPMPWGGDRFDGTVKYNLLDANKEPVICGDNSNEDGGPYGTLDSSTDDLLIALSNCLPQLLDEIEALRKAQGHQLCELMINQLMTQAEELRNTRAEPVRKARLPDGLTPFAPHVETEYANGWNTFRERLMIVLKAAGIDVTQ